MIRVAKEEDKRTVDHNKRPAKEALEVCHEKLKNISLEMNLVDVEYTFDRNKIIFYFTAEGRVDFRNLVKDLAAIFRTRIKVTPDWST